MVRIIRGREKPVKHKKQVWHSWNRTKKQIGAEFLLKAGLDTLSIFQCLDLLFIYCYLPQLPFAEKNIANPYNQGGQPVLPVPKEISPYPLKLNT